MTEISWLKSAVEKKEKKTKESSGLLSTGSTLLNLALSGKRNGGLLPGHFYLLVGDSMAGKTWLLKTIMAESCKNPFYKDYRLIFDNPERGSLMDHVKFFGKEMASKLEDPSKKGCSKTSEEFYDNVDDAVREGKPFFYGLDSEDALQPESALKLASKNKNKRKQASGGSEQEIKGSYGTEKAKINSTGLRSAHNGLEDTKSILIIIKQSRDNIGPGAMFNPKTRSGGRALTFYAAVELWFSIKGKIRKTVKGKPRVIGTLLKIHVKKNRVSGLDRIIEIPFYPSVGLDDTGSMIDFLIEESHWTGGKGDSVVAPEFDFSGKREKLIEIIEEGNKEPELRKLTEATWKELELAIAVKRKSRYT